MTNIRSVLMGGVACFALFAADSAMAQETAPEPPDEQGLATDASNDDKPSVETAGIAEIVVTARRRNESLLETPVAVTAFDAAELERRQITSVADIQNSTPSLVFESAAGNSSDARVYIRGVGNANPNVTAEQGVGIYIDGVFYGRSQGALIDNIDVASIEVLRGPQGTLFGKNTIGGAVNITTAKPDDDYVFGAAELTYGSFNRLRARGMINLPLTDGVAIRAAVLRDRDDGFSVNDTDERELDNRDTWAFQGALRIQPADSLTWDVSAIYADDRSHGRAAECVQINPDPVFGPAFVPACAATNANGIRHTRSNEFLTGYVNTLAIGTTLQYDFGQVAFFDDLTIKAIGGYQRTDSMRTIDFDATELDGVHSEDFDRQTEQLSGELQLVGSAADGRFNFATGLYVDQERSPGDGTRYTGVYPFLEAFGSTLSTIQALKLLNDSLAVYFQGTFDLNDIVSVTGGIRYTDETKGFSLFKAYVSDSAPLIPVGAPTADGVFQRKYGTWTPMASVQLNAPEAWQDGGFLSNGMLYFTYSKGFKGGGFNGNGDTVSGNITSYEPEKVDNYELGLKFAVFDRRLIGSLAAYTTDYDNIQLPVQGQSASGAPISSVFNAGAAKIKGLELELEALLGAGFRVGLNADVTDAVYTRFDDGGVDRSGEPVNYVPEYRISASLGNEFQLGGTATLTPRIQVTATGDRTLVTDISPAIRATGFVDAYTVIDASIRLQLNDALTFTAYAKNLFDEVYVNDVLPIGYLSLRYYGAPATYGVSAKLNF